MDATTIIAGAALFLAVLTFIATQIGGKRTATETYVQSLERRIETLENELSSYKSRNTVLESENINLLRQIVAMKGQL